MIFWKNSLKCIQAKIEFEIIQLLCINQTIPILYKKIKNVFHIYTQHNLLKYV